MAMQASTVPPHSMLLPPLSSVRMEPKWCCDVPNISSPLLRIEQVGIVRSNIQEGKDANYTIDIYFEEPTSRIPTSTMCKTTARKQSAAPNRMPTVQVSRTLSQFATLRDNVQSCVELTLQSCTCDYCVDLRAYFTFGPARPLAMARLAISPQRDASQPLEEMIVRLLDQSRQLLMSRRRGTCRGQLRIPYLLYRFLQPTTDHSHEHST